MHAFMIIPELAAGPTLRIEELPRLVHPHPSAVADLNDRAIWRYMDLPKYLSLLATSALYFTRADQLSEMDPMERSWGMPDLQDENAQANAGARKSLRQIMGMDFVSCWHLNDFESAAMWDIYARFGASVALKTTLRRFAAAFSSDNAMDASHWRLIPLEVQYLDFQKQGVGLKNALDLLRSKRKSYEHEHEIRMVLEKPVQIGVDDVVGVHLPVDINALIDAVYVNPKVPAWVFDAVSEVSTRFNVPKGMIRKSEMDAQPLV